ncbi:MAG: alpha/beta fold hydrolase [Gemmatimonadetes bacterium]|nr:alpha/beta fold hydrolase [Gemmatimonadota bacterium]MYG83949.1 alpha/beta fold hydrolase [Gemmatimonadota bacterium]MYJ91137.1 alpha/beta fold hydrolase [Gemmatimonadota bacterium]
MHAVREHYQIGRWIMIGHSFGADLVLAYSMRHPEHVLGQEDKLKDILRGFVKKFARST